MVEAQTRHRIPHCMCDRASLLEEVATMVNMVMAITNDTVNLRGASNR
jgi:methyl coenzyme M reductase subunit C-like uncharacterized protein (methanogenesis marker protein 7)